MPVEYTALTLFDSYDNIAVGGKFGVRVGMTSQVADAMLRRTGWTPAPAGVNELMRSCGGRMLGPNEAFEVYSEESWHKGVVCLFVASHRVVAVGWVFSPLSP